MISPAHGLSIARLVNEKDQLQMLQAIVFRKLSVRATENALKEFGCELSAASFAQKDCMSCQHNGTQQKDMFDRDTDLKGRCLNPKCYHEKARQHVVGLRESITKRGGVAVSEHEFKKKFNRTCYNSPEIAPDVKKKLKKQYAEKCLKCQYHVFCIEPREQWAYGKNPLVVRERCGNSSDCINALVRGKKADPGEINKDKERERIKEDRERRLEIARRQFFVSHVKGASPVVIKALTFLCVGDYYSDREVVYEEVTGKKISDVGITDLLSLTEKQLDAMIVLAVQSTLLENHGSVNDDEMPALLKAIKADIKRDFVITEEYLAELSDPELVRLMQEIGLDKYLIDEKKIKSFAALGEMFKDKEKGRAKVVALFLESGFDLKGKVPKEIAK
jgi:hypothetical protein